jgi:hypothetical protein
MQQQKIMNSTKWGLSGHSLGGGVVEKAFRGKIVFLAGFTFGEMCGSTF